VCDATYFTHPQRDWQRRYEALRALLVDRLPAQAVADRFGYKTGYVRLLKHQFRRGKIDFDEPVSQGRAARRRVTSKIRAEIRRLRDLRLSSGEITELLGEEGIDISVRTVERVLAEEGYPRLPRRTRIKVGLTVQGAEIPQHAQAVTLADLEGRRFDCAGAGVFLFAPFLA
jgi:transposase